MRHAAHAVPQGDALAGLLLPWRRHEGGRRKLARADRFTPRSENRGIHHGEGALLPPGRRGRVTVPPGDDRVERPPGCEERLTCRLRWTLRIRSPTVPQSRA